MVTQKLNHQSLIQIFFLQLLRRFNEIFIINAVELITELGIISQKNVFSHDFNNKHFILQHKTQHYFVTLYNFTYFFTSFTIYLVESEIFFLSKLVMCVLIYTYIKKSNEKKIYIKCFYRFINTNYKNSSIQFLWLCCILS